MYYLLLLLLSHFSHVRFCATPETASYQAPPSLGFSGQEHWSGLPFPSPMHESEKWKGSRSVVSDSATSRTIAHQAPPSMGFSRQEYWSRVPLPSPTNCHNMRYLCCTSTLKTKMIQKQNKELGEKWGKEEKTEIFYCSFKATFS